MEEELSIFKSIREKWDKFQKKEKTALEVTVGDYVETPEAKRERIERQKREKEERAEERERRRLEKEKMEAEYRSKMQPLLDAENAEIKSKHYAVKMSDAQNILNLFKTDEIYSFWKLIGKKGGFTADTVARRYGEAQIKMYWNQYGYDALVRAWRSAKNRLAAEKGIYFDLEKWSDDYKIRQNVVEIMETVGDELENYTQKKGVVTEAKRIDWHKFVDVDHNKTRWTWAEIDKMFGGVPDTSEKNRWGYAVNGGWRKKNQNPKNPKSAKPKSAKPKSAKPKSAKPKSAKPEITLGVRMKKYKKPTGRAVNKILKAVKKDKDKILE